MSVLTRVRTADDEATARADTVRAAGGYVLLALLAYVPPLLSARGRVAADTKQYLYLDPGRLLRTAVSMWDPNVGMGTVTHQTIGYVFPMGPYYWVVDKLGVPMWVAQRLWLGSLLFFAAAGVLYLLRTFGMRGTGIVVAALAYMFTPYVLDYAARISVLLMPWAALPWLIGLVRKALRDGGWRYPALFALVVQIVGGVNATALLFVGLAPALWLGYAWLVVGEVEWRRVASVTARTGFLTLVTSLWWIAGLRMQGAYGLDILKYTETVEAVARTSSPNEVLRGLGYWFFYGQDRLGPWIEVARDYTQHSVVILAGYLLAASAFLGAALLRWRHRAFFVVLLLVGVVVAVGAHPYAHPTPLGALFKAFATGSTAGLALRSTARAVPLVALALAVFVGLGTNAGITVLRRRAGSVAAWALPALVLVLVAVNFPPLFDHTFYGKNLQRPESIPAYWRAAIAALDRGDHNTRILEIPGSDFASYRWGNTVDPITPGLTDRPYVARELIPYGTAGTADLLNAMDRRLQEGAADPRGLVAVWRRMGIGDVVARNDIQYERYDVLAPRELRRLLATVPGLGAPQAFGPVENLSAPGHVDEVALTAPANEPFLAPVVVYPIDQPSGIVRTESVDGSLVLSGDGEGLVDAADVGLLDSNGALQYSASYPDAAALRAAVAPGSVLVVTDENRLRARKWSSVKDNLGYTEQAGGADAPLTTDPGDARLDVFPGETAAALATTIDEGVERVVSTAYGNTITYTPEDRAAMALDGDPYTAWRTQAFGDAIGQRIRIDLDAPVTTDHVNLVQPLTGGRDRWITEVRLTFDGGAPRTYALGDGSRTIAGETLTFGRRTFHTLEIEVTRVNDPRRNLFGAADAVGFAEIRLRDEHARTDVHEREVVQMPTDLMDALGADAAGHPLVIVMRRDLIRPTPPRSQPELDIARRFIVTSTRAFALTGNATVSPDAPDAQIEHALGIADAAHGGVTVSSKEFLLGCIACRADAAIDGDPSTAWQTPFVGVRKQWMEFDSAAPHAFDHMDLTVIADGRHSVPTRLLLEVDGARRVLDVPPIADGRAENATATVHLRFPRVSGSRVRVTIVDVREEHSLRFGSNADTLDPAAIAELGLPGLHLPRAPAWIDSGCRRDLVRVDGRPFPVRVTGPAAGARTLLGLDVAPCDPNGGAAVPALTLTPGPHVVETARGKDAGFSLDRLVLASGSDGTPLPVAGGRVTSVPDARAAVPTVRVVQNGRTRVRVHVSGASSAFWLVLGQSQSDGWRAHIVRGASLGPSHLVDGYANGWRVAPPSPSFDVVFEWTPQRQVWAALWISLLGAIACVALVAVSWRKRSRVAIAAATVAPAIDGEVALRVAPAGRLTGRRRWTVPLAAGLLAALVSAPWIGAAVAALTALAVLRPSTRRVIAFLPALLLAEAGLYVALAQHEHRYPAVFEWPTLFPSARTLAWLAVALLAADAMVEIARTRRATQPGPSP